MLYTMDILIKYYKQLKVGFLVKIKALLISNIIELISLKSTTFFYYYYELVCL